MLSQRITAPEDVSLLVGKTWIFHDGFSSNAKIHGTFMDRVLEIQGNFTGPISVYNLYECKLIIILKCFLMLICSILWQ